MRPPAQPAIRLYSRITIRDAQGHVVKRSRWALSHSYLKQFVQILRAHMRVSDESSVLDTGNTSRTLEASIPGAYVLAISTAAGVSTDGLVVGTGSTAVTISDYALGTQIAHGVGSGQMEYGTGSIGSAVVSGSTASFTVSRTFTNSSGASITINEVGIYVIATDSAAVSRYFCIVRDVSATGLPATVLNTQTFTVEFKISVTA